MQVGAQQAQDMFLRDIAPELARDGSFFVYSESPGLLAFSDGVVDRPGGFDEDEDIAHEPAMDAGLPDQAGVEIGAKTGPFPVESEELSVAGGAAPAVLRREPRLYGGLRRMFARRIKVRFASEGEGTHVTISGSAHGLVASGLNKLGQQGHWPETAGRPHD